MKSLIVIALSFAASANAQNLNRAVRCLEQGSRSPYVFVVESRSEVRDFGTPAERPPWNQLSPSVTVYPVELAGIVYASIQLNYGMSSSFMEIPMSFFDEILAAVTNDELALIQPVNASVLIQDWDNHGAPQPDETRIPMTCDVDYAR